MPTLERLWIDVRKGKKRILILGAGYAGMGVALKLQKQLPPDKFEIALVGRENFWLQTPLLFEAGSGVLEFRHVVTPIRELFTTALFYQGIVEGFRPDENTVQIVSLGGTCYDVSYDHLVVAIGGITNRQLIPGSQHALAFKVLGDAILLRNNIIDALERAETEFDAKRRAQLLTFVVIGGGLVGVELMGELTQMIEGIRIEYPSIKKEEIRFHLIDGGPRILKEMEAGPAAYAARVLIGRGVRITLNMRVKEILESGVVLQDGTTIASAIKILASGTAANPVLAQSGLVLSKHGHIVVDNTMLAKGRTNVWALGDCAEIPDPTGQPYPPLAQHAVREARVLGGNLVAVLTGRGKVRPFAYKHKGTLAALGHYSGIAQTPFFHATGFLAWWIWRTYYLFQMPLWSRRVRIIMDWTLALLFPPDTFKIDLGPRTPSGRRTDKP